MAYTQPETSKHHEVMVHMCHKATIHALVETKKPTVLGSSKGLCFKEGAHYHSSRTGEAKNMQKSQVVWAKALWSVYNNCCSKLRDC